VQGRLAQGRSVPHTDYCANRARELKMTAANALHSKASVLAKNDGF